MQKISGIIKKYLNWNYFPYFLLIFIILLVIICNLVGNTLAIVLDREKSSENHFGAWDLDFSLESTPDFSPALLPDIKAEREIKVKKVTGEEYPYQSEVLNLSDEFCKELKLEVDMDGHEYEDDLDKFSYLVGSFSPDDLWKFKVSLKDDDAKWENKTCEFDLVFRGKQSLEHNLGFSDYEEIKCKVETGQWGPTSPGPGDVVINELMWMGSDGATADEWIELRNMTDQDIDLSNWDIENGGSGGGHIEIPNGYTLKAGGYFLIIRKKWDETAINLVEDLDKDEGYTHVAGMNLLNDGEKLTLDDKDDNVIDTAWKDGADWPEGSNGTEKQSMERKADPGDGTDANNWKTCTDALCNGDTYWDVEEGEEGRNYGTPGKENI